MLPKGNEKLSELNQLLNGTAKSRFNAKSSFQEHWDRQPFHFLLPSMSSEGSLKKVNLNQSITYKRTYNADNPKNCQWPLKKTRELTSHVPFHFAILERERGRVNLRCSTKPVSGRKLYIRKYVMYGELLCTQYMLYQYLPLYKGTL